MMERHAYPPALRVRVHITQHVFSQSQKIIVRLILSGEVLQDANLAKQDNLLMSYQIHVEMLQLAQQPKITLIALSAIVHAFRMLVLIV